MKPRAPRLWQARLLGSRRAIVAQKRKVLVEDDDREFAFIEYGEPVVS
jgi:hypothetical protein